MSVIVLAVEDNTAPNLDITLERDGTVIDLTGATVELITSKANTGEVTNTGHQSCTIVPPATGGVIRYTRQAADFPDEGRYLGEVKITYLGGTVERLHNLLNIIVRGKTA